MRFNWIITAALAAGVSLGTNAKDFNESFCDSTLRVDYIFGGGPGGVKIMLNGQSKQKGWAGRRHRLDKTPVAGNGTILVTDPVTGDTLYRNAFSSLFQEWICTPEALEKDMAFENSFLVPLPKKEAEIVVSLRDNRHQEISRLKHRYTPSDELVALRGQNPMPHKYLFRGGDPKDVIDIAILAEGYTQEEMDTFLTKAKIITEEILSYEPFASNKEKFNVVAVMTPSKESGVSIPLKKEWKDTALRSHFSTFYSSRYLTTPNVKKMHELLEGIPYEHVLVLVNTPAYGGGGIFNSYQIATSDNNLTLPVAVHEFGHSFGGLADEYFYAHEEEGQYPLDIEPWEPNITTLVDFKSKWEDMVSPDVQVPTPWKEEPKDKHNKTAKIDINKEETVGVYEGAGYKSKGVYRPVITCRMRDNFHPSFCPVCERAIQNMIDFYTAQ